MLAKVKKYINEQGLIKPGELVIAGVSGGPDSMVMLDLLNRLRSRLSFELVVAHLNHGLRPEAEAEENFVRQYCENLKIPFYSRQLNVEEIALREKKSLEEAGRDSRYRFFAELAWELGASRIATAHHQDDNAETLLLNIIRGSGIKGLRGIRPVNGKIIRPLLCVDRSEIENYLLENSIPYCVDQSNYSSDYLRNRIRLELLPLLKENYNPRMVDSLNQLADIAGLENEAMQLETARLGKELVIEKTADEIILNAEGILQLHPAFQRRLILMTLAALQGESGWDWNDVEQIRTLLDKSGSSKSLQLKKGIRVKKIYQQIVFSLKKNRKSRFNYLITVPGQLFIPEIGREITFSLLQQENFKPEPGDFYLDYDKIKGELYLRSRRPGDLFWPRGMQGKKKIKDFFIDLKVPQEERDLIPLLAGEEIYAVVGFRVSQKVTVDSDTRRILLIKSTCRDKNN